MTVLRDLQAAGLHLAQGDHDHGSRSPSWRSPTSRCVPPLCSLSRAGWSAAAGLHWVRHYAAELALLLNPLLSSDLQRFGCFSNAADRALMHVCAAAGGPERNGLHCGGVQWTSGELRELQVCSQSPCPFAVWSSPLCRLVQSPVRACAQMTDFKCAVAPSATGACVYVY